MGTPSKDKYSLADFTFLDSGKAAACPQGHTPLNVKQKEDKFSAVFASETCSACPFMDQCPVKIGSKGHYLRYDKKAFRLARRRASEKTAEFMKDLPLSSWR